MIIPTVPLQIGSFILRTTTPNDSAALSALAGQTFREAYSANLPEKISTPSS